MRQLDVQVLVKVKMLWQNVPDKQQPNVTPFTALSFVCVSGSL